MNSLLEEITAWADETFPSQTIPGLLSHISSEVEELIKCPDDGSEMADIVTLVFYLAHMQNIDLFEEIRKKHEINKTRVWSTADPITGIIHHKE